MRTPATSQYLTVPEVVARYRVSKDHVYRPIREGELEAIRVGEHGPLRVSGSALDVFIRPAAGAIETRRAR